MVNLKEGIMPSVIGFIKDKGIIKIALIILVGLALIFLGVSSGGTEEAERDELEAGLEELCSSLVGVGKCRVMVTYERAESRYGKESEQRVESVAVVCRGADNARVRSELTSLLTSLFGIGAHRIKIAKMK